ncbi:MAG: glycosyltransferase [Lewinellaceae bacterium]|nr:glycosyltransferase [Lewinellaceae bacterium]
MKTVLIFAYECAPFNRSGATIGAQRPAQFAKHLPKFGWNAIVLCCDVNSRWQISIEEAKQTIPNLVKKKLQNFDRAGSIIIPIPSIRYSDWVDNLWMRSIDIDSESGNIKLKPGTINRITTKVSTFFKLFSGDYSASWIAPAKIATIEILKTVQLEACIAEHSPDASLFLSRWLNQKYKIPWIIDFRDQILMNLPKIIWPLYNHFLRRYFKTVSATIAVNRHLAAMDEKIFRKPFFVIPNGYDLEEFKDLSHSSSPADTFFRIVYTGNILYRDQLKPFFEALQMLVKERPNLRLRFVYRGMAKETILNYSSQFGISQWMDIKGIIPRSQALQLLKGADLLLLLSASPDEQSVFFSKGVQPGKAFEYLAAGKPILCTPGDEGLLDELIQETCAGVIISNPKRLSSYLFEVYEKWEQKKDIPYKPRKEVIKNYSRENLARKLADILNQQ